MKKFTKLALAGVIGLSGLGLVGTSEASAATSFSSGSTASQSNKSYNIVVKTGTETDAGTDANVTITIYGKNGSTGPIALGNGQDNFENGDEDIFNVIAKDVGEVTSIRLYQDGSGHKPGWYVESVKINGKSFGVNSWLGDSSSGSYNS
ncbi:hypothetical protein BAMA_15480 [Bacillus manliponensis]|uniref:PLAT domain-containing protein n=1 Tax=Bacillus manliponensis TaxID=574376 RepID=A0A073JT38_9BACI|nr:PLAT/LH2 domain-containing protein [Bacillus manliponensis]KEK17356.1 hypothetical protein BAMA_15480 [Bacillus manliponensis]